MRAHRDKGYLVAVDKRSGTITVDVIGVSGGLSQETYSEWGPDIAELVTYPAGTELLIDTEEFDGEVRLISVQLAEEAMEPYVKAHYLEVRTEKLEKALRDLTKRYNNLEKYYKLNVDKLNKRFSEET